MSRSHSGGTPGAEKLVADVKQATPEEAAKLLEQGYVYVDVRTEAEFEQGHPPGALNVPISHAGPAGMTPNAEFLQVMEQAGVKPARGLDWNAIVASDSLYTNPIALMPELYDNTRLAELLLDLMRLP